MVVNDLLSKNSVVLKHRFYCTCISNILLKLVTISIYLLILCLGIGEQDEAEVSSNDEGSNLNDSFTSRSSGGLHSPRSPGGSRLEDQLPAFVPPKRYVKPEEKKDTKAPGVMIMV